MRQLLIAYVAFWYRLGLLRWSKLRWFRRWFDQRMIRKYGPEYFDDEFYLEANADIANAGVQAIDHYVSYGLRERRRPHVLFDVDFYRDQTPPGERHMLPLVHYILFGRKRGYRPNPWFDPFFYTANIRESPPRLADAFSHYLALGFRQNVRPSASFDPATYLLEYPEAAAAGMPALEHLIRYNINANERLREASLQQLPQPRIGAAEVEGIDDPLQAILALPANIPSEPLIDVIVPVYAGYDETMRCLYTVLSSKNRTPWRLVVVDDHSPEPQLTADLSRLAELGYFELIYQETNKGFVGSVNDGMRFSTETEVILLNSDTEVFGDWIDRLSAVAGMDDRISTVTPMTNNGTICGYPVFPNDNPDPLECPYATLDRMAAERNAGKWVELPTAIGFCMYIKRAALEDVGLFDEEAFGRGYGEENDFCLRAQQAGWIDAMAPNVFVRHLGSTSFKGEKAARVENALNVIRSRYPYYDLTVQEFIRDDPIKPFRAEIDLARLEAQCRDRNVLVVNHARGGGTEQRIRELTAQWEKEGAAVFRLLPAGEADGHVYLFHQDVGQPVNLPPWRLATERLKLLSVLRRLGITEIQVHHTIDFGRHGTQHLHALLKGLGIPYTILAHDYFAICPRINLADETGFYCGEPDVSGCNSCLATRGSAEDVQDIVRWRRDFAEFYADAETILTPSQDTAARLQRYFPDTSPIASPHEPNLEPAPLGPPRNRQPGEPVRIGIIGAIGDVKGFNILIDCAGYAKSERVRVQFVVVGYTRDDPGAVQAGIELTGPYSNDHALEVVKAQKLDLIWLPSVWPETYSYTLSLALQTGLPIGAFDIGAFSERLEGLPGSLLLPLALAKQPAELVKRLVEHAEIANGARSIAA